MFCLFFVGSLSVFIFAEHFVLVPAFFSANRTLGLEQPLIGFRKSASEKCQVFLKKQYFCFIQTRAMNEKVLQITVHILRIAIAAPVGYYLGEYLGWERFMLLLLYFGTYMVVSLLIEMLRKSIFPYPDEDDFED
jgi:hypothetical protein